MYLLYTTLYMNVIGHRGAAGLAPENTAKSIKTAIDIGVDGVEFDIRTTLDGQLVLLHDDNLKRTHSLDKKISKLTLNHINKLLDLQGLSICTLKEALDITNTTPTFIEGKGGGWAKPLSKLLQNHPARQFATVISFNLGELQSFHSLSQGTKCMILENHNPMDALNNARIFNFDGVDINFWTLNPVFYWLCQRRKLDVILYTVNKPWIARIISILYPHASITTDRPDKMQFLRTNNQKNAQDKK